MGARVSSEQAEAIAESIMDWRDPNDYPMENGAESDYYKSLEHPYKAKNKDFQMLDELLLVKGVSPDIYERVKNYLTVYGKGTVNINTAGTVVLTSLGLTEDLAERIIKYRNGDDRKEGTDDDRTFDQADQIPEVLTLDRVIDQDGVTQLQRVLTSNWLGTHSDNFSGVCQGIARGAAGLTRVDFVISRDQTIWFWRQE
ncbi:MAG: hypothetical protein COT00_01810 [Candidatus Omnitrophica bacterium CG07_land_8_20_14_0_80_50_8]|nr:MAG: hypothetical protein COT00_01810 [Candidatus Omnitrophica bacterium CG07_land_8_20_14_0_80_50_8]